MKIVGVIFDLDGVLVHTDHLHYLAWKALADRLGIYFDEEINHRLRGVSRMESLEIILERYTGQPLSQEEKQALAEEKNETYIRLLDTMSPKDVTDEVRGTLAQLRRRGYRLAVGSSSKNAKKILQKTELFSCFDEISDGTNIRKSKPDPEVFLKAAEYLRVEPSRCMVVEDADAGIRAAWAGGMQVMAVGDAAAQGKADFNLGKFSEMLEILP